MSVQAISPSQTHPLPLSRAQEEGGRGRRPSETPAAIGEPAIVRWLLIGLALLFLALVLVVPLAAVFAQALEKGLAGYGAALANPSLRFALQLTLLTAAVTVPLNLMFGVAAAWALTRFDFWGKQLLVTLIDLPFAVSPVIAGLAFVLLFGAQGLLGPWLQAHGLKIIFTPIGIILAMIFVTFPFVARQVMPVMEAQGRDDEEAAVSLGAGGWQTFWRVTLPNVRWGLLYGVILCNARAMGEFGAVSVVSGRIRDVTATLPLHVEILYNEYDFVGAFAAASLLVFLALATPVAQVVLEARTEPEPADAGPGDQEDYR